MSDRVLIALPDGRWLALGADVLEAALRAGAAATAAQGDHGSARSAEIEPLLSAEDAAQQIGVTARWLEDSARAGIIPHHRFGASRRFRVSELAEHSYVAGAPSPTDSESFTPIRRLSRQ